ncbi:hypothetical protein GCM10022226_24510 [Sphaerisporangium flaviroseum]|uniref:Uncharacterized protein n=1 Tax=Sphaerisporangium flaviroseum TaxID=509199 RepID=A0ABP7HUA9_9ACTN
MDLPAAFAGVIALVRFSRSPVGVRAPVVNQLFGKGSRHSAPAIGSHPEADGAPDGVGVAGAATAGTAEPVIIKAIRVKIENARGKRTCPPGSVFLRRRWHF